MIPLEKASRILQGDHKLFKFTGNCSISCELFAGGMERDPVRPAALFNLQEIVLFPAWIFCSNKQHSQRDRFLEKDRRDKPLKADNLSQ